MNHRKLLWTLTTLVAALALSACQSTQVAESQGNLPPTGIIAQGHAEPLSSLDVSFTVPGRVTEVLVAEGGTVQAGQVLARLSGSEPRAADLLRARQELLNAQQALTDLKANPELVKAQAAASVADAKKALADATKKLDDLNNPDPLLVSQLEARVSLLKQQLDKSREALQDLQDQTDPDPLKLAQAQAAVADGEKALNDAQQALNDLKSPDGLLIAQAEAHITLLEAQLAKAKADAESLQGGTDPDLLAAAQARLDSAQAALISAEAAAASLELRAPAGGVIVGLNLKAGQPAPTGQPALTIADFSQWLVKTDDLTELEVVDVQNGQSVSVTFDALPDAPLTGKVIATSQRYEDQRGDVTYTVTIALDNPPAALRWGMTGQVNFSQDK